MIVRPELVEGLSFAEEVENRVSTGSAGTTWVGMTA
jgi:hypothetical protein